MSDYTELVKALRRLSTAQDTDNSLDWVYGSQQAMHDAAAAIEELQAEVDALKHDIERYVQMNTELLNDRPELEEIGGKWVWKEPKRCEWIYHPKDAIEMMFTLPKCSICGHESSDALNYCPNCGAKMEVQE